MAFEKSLKEQNELSYWLFAVANIAILISLVVCGSIDLQHMTTVMKIITSKDGVWISLLPILGVVLNGLLPSNVKAMIVYTRFKRALPGHRVFSKLGKADSRINLERIATKYGKLPRNPIEQNKLWYDIYKKHQDKHVIQDSHKKFLLMRDIASLSLIIWLVSVIVFIIFYTLKIVVIFYLIFGAIQFLVTMISARNYGNRFTCNVLAEESGDNRQAPNRLLQV